MRAHDDDNGAAAIENETELRNVHARKKAMATVVRTRDVTVMKAAFCARVGAVGASRIGIRLCVVVDKGISGTAGLQIGWLWYLLWV